MAISRGRTLLDCRRTRIVAAFIVVALASACGGGGGGGDSSSASVAAVQTCPKPDPNANSLNERVYTYLQDWYLWCDQLPALNPNSFQTVSALIDAIRYRPTEYDRFSYVDTFANYSAFFAEGKTSGYGFALTRLPNNVVAITYTEPASPAALGGLRRGQTVVSINGYTTAQLDANLGGGYTTQLDGRPATVVVTDGNTQLAPITVVLGTYPLTSVWHAELVTPAIGYLHVKQFVATTKTEIRTTFAKPGWGAVTDLIVDLRYNGGGSVLESARMSSHIVGAPHAGKRFAFLQFNTQHDAKNDSIPFGDTENGVSLLRATPILRVAVIVSSRTCSASEEALAAIRATIPAADFFIVGRAATCGKPFGFLPALFQVRVGIDDPNDPVVSAINFRSIAADGTTDYIKGFAPRCVISDDLNRPLTDPLEAQRQGARVAVETGACPVGTTAIDRPQPLAEERPRQPDPLPGGLKRQHGSW